MTAPDKGKTVESSAAHIDAFAPPDEKAGNDGPSAIPVALVWAMSGAAAGVGIGAWAQTLGMVKSLVPEGLGGAAVWFVLGAIAFRTERHYANRKKELLDGRGRLVRPLSAWLVTVPMALGAAGFLALALAALLRTGSSTPILIFVLAMIGMVGVSRPVIGSRSLARAVEMLDAGRVLESQQRMLWIEAAPWWTANVRSMAALNLGYIALTQSRLDDAAHWYGRANRGKDRALACTGLALVRALQDDPDEAERQLTRAGKSGEGRHAQAEIDGVRLLVALRRDGAEEAARLGDRLRNPNSGGLFLGLLACAHARHGNEAAAKEVLEEHAAREMIDSAFGDVVPELRELKWVGDVG